MANPKASRKARLPADEPAAYLDMPPERRAAAKAHAALLSRTADRIALRAADRAPTSTTSAACWSQEAKP